MQALVPDATSTCTRTKELASSPLVLDLMCALPVSCCVRSSILKGTAARQRLIAIISFSPRYRTYMFVFGCIDSIINASAPAQLGYSSPSVCPLCVGYHSSYPCVQLSHASLVPKESKSYLEGC